jgi:hypothetical protein
LYVAALPDHLFCVHQSWGRWQRQRRQGQGWAQWQWRWRAQPAARRRFRRTSGSSTGWSLGLLQPLGHSVAIPAAAAVGCALCAPSTGTHRLLADPVLHCRRSPGVRASRQLGSDQLDRRSQPDGDSRWVCTLGHGQRSDIPHVLQRRHFTLPSPVATILHYSRQRSIYSCFQSWHFLHTNS